MFRRSLQIALDLPDLDVAVKIASQVSYSLGCERLIIEAGTPLIKTWGILAVKLLKRVTNCMVFADTKTIDVGDLEARIMYDSGADIVSVLGVADDYTIARAVEEAEKRGKYVAVDLMNVEDPLKRIKDVGRVGAHIIIYHVGIDVQEKKGVTVDQLFSNVKKVVVEAKKYGMVCAVAGGLKPGKISRFKDIGVDIVIVGSAITRSKDPVNTVREIIREFIY